MNPELIPFLVNSTIFPLPVLFSSTFHSLTVTLPKIKQHNNLNFQTSTTQKPNSTTPKISIWPFTIKTNNVSNNSEIDNTLPRNYKNMFLENNQQASLNIYFLKAFWYTFLKFLNQ